MFDWQPVHRGQYHIGSRLRKLRQKQDRRNQLTALPSNIKIQISPNEEKEKEEKEKEKGKEKEKKDKDKDKENENEKDKEEKNKEEKNKEEKDKEDKEKKKKDKDKDKLPCLASNSWRPFLVYRDQLLETTSDHIDPKKEKLSPCYTMECAI